MKNVIEELILLREHSQLLVLNDWRYEIPTEQRNIILANALNQCANDKKFTIVGYLITNRRVFLIGASETTSFQEILQYFYTKVGIGISAYKKTNNTYHDEYQLGQHQLFKNILFTTIISEKLSLVKR